MRLSMRRAQSVQKELVRDGVVSAFAKGEVAKSAHEVMVEDEPMDGGRHWLRVNVRDEQGKLLVLGNPVYVNFVAR